MASVTMTPFVMALPVGRTLLRKGAASSIVLAYLALVGVCRIPMTLFEVSCLGIEFTATRWIASILMIFLSLVIFGRLLDKKKIVPLYH